MAVFRPNPDSRPFGRMMRMDLVSRKKEEEGYNWKENKDEKYSIRKIEKNKRARSRASISTSHLAYGTEEAHRSLSHKCDTIGAVCHQRNDPRNQLGNAACVTFVSSPKHTSIGGL